MLETIELATEEAIVVHPAHITVVDVHVTIVLDHAPIHRVSVYLHFNLHYNISCLHGYVSHLPVLKCMLEHT